MARSNNVAIISLEEAKARFEEWRNNRGGKARIPADLWSAAVEVARKEGINRTARELHVAWDDLKRRMPAPGAVPRQPAFVELVTPPVSISNGSSRRRLSEGKNTKKDKKFMNLRKDIYEGKIVEIIPHVKVGNKEPRLLRVHFYPDHDRKIIQYAKSITSGSTPGGPAEHLSL
jgi:hypothetical protein